MKKISFTLKMKKLLVLTIVFSSLVINYSYGREDSYGQGNDTIKSVRDFGKWDRFSLSLGYFIEGNNSGITLGSKQLGLGMVIDIEDALNLDVASSVFRGNACYSFGRSKRHSVLVDYFNINRKATKVLEADLELGDVTFPIGTRITSKYYISIIRAKYDYSFFQDKRVSLGASFGFFILPVNFSVRAGGSEGQSTKMVAPLPVLGIRSNFAITPKLYLKESADLLYLKIDNFAGSILDINIAMEHKTFKHFGFGAAINAFKLRIKAEGNDYPNINFFGDLGIEFTGITLYGSYYF